MNQVNWQDVTPSFEQYEEILSNAPSLPLKSFIDLQPRLEATIRRFVNVRGLTRILLVNCTDNSVYRGFIRDALQTTTDIPVVVTESLDAKELFDRYSVNLDGQTTFESGLIAKAHGGYLIVPANLVLANAARWPSIKAAIQGGSFAPTNLTPNRIASSPLGSQEYDVKLVITGDRNQLAEIEYIDEDFSAGITMYTEVEEDIHLSEESLRSYIGLVNWVCKRYQYPALSSQAFRRLILAGMRYTEDQHYLPLGVMWHSQLLALASQYANASVIEFDDIDKAIDDKYYRESYLPQRAVDDIELTPLSAGQCSITELFQVCDLVPQHSGTFKIQRNRRLLHFTHQIPNHFLIATFKQAYGAFDVLRIVLGRDIANARRGATFNLVLKTWSRAIAKITVFALANLE